MTSNNRYIFRLSNPARSQRDRVVWTKAGHASRLAGFDQMNAIDGDAELFRDDLPVGDAQARSDGRTSQPSARARCAGYKEAVRPGRLPPQIVESHCNARDWALTSGAFRS
jgi:hypothetical protein